MLYPALFAFIRRYVEDFSEAEWIAFEPEFQLKRHSKAEVVLQQGEMPEQIGFVLSGFFKTGCATDSGREYVKIFRGPGELLGAYAELLEGCPSKVSIVSLEASEVLWISHKKITDQFKKDRAWETLSRRLTEELFILKERREFELLTHSAKERYEEFLKRYPEHVKNIPAHQIASYLGITPVVYSRLKKHGKSSAPKSRKST